MKFINVPRLRIGSLALVAVLAAACGGGGGGDSSAVSAPQTNTSSPPGSTANAAPTIQGAPGGSVVAGQQYTFTPSASDANGDALTFSVANLPAWASFDTATGRISGTPAVADVATYNGVTISVSDGKASASLAVFAIAVTATGTGSATLSWAPPTTNADGSQLTNGAGYEVRYGRSADDLSQSVSLTNASLSTYVVENLSPGTWYFAVATVNSQGVKSVLTNVASKTVT